MSRTRKIAAKHHRARRTKRRTHRPKTSGSKNRRSKRVVRTKRHVKRRRNATRKVARMKTRRPRGRKRSGGSGVAKHAASVSAGKDISKGISESEWAGLADATNKGASKEDVTAPAQSIARETSASGFARKAAAKAAKASNPTDSIAAKHGVEKIGEFGGEAAAGLVAAKILKKGITRSISAIKALRSGSSADAGELAAADTASAAESTASTLTGDAATAAAGAAAEAAAADSAADIAADAGEVAADAT